LVKATGRDGAVKPHVACSANYFGRGWSEAPTTKDGRKCTNTPFACPAEGCTGTFWKFGMDAHWREKHSQVPQPVGAANRAPWARGPVEEKYMATLVGKLVRARREALGAWHAGVMNNV
jgi:hypothetical protein